MTSGEPPRGVIASRNSHGPVVIRWTAPPRQRAGRARPEEPAQPALEKPGDYSFGFAIDGP